MRVCGAEKESMVVLAAVVIVLLAAAGWYVLFGGDEKPVGPIFSNPSMLIHFSIQKCKTSIGIDGSWYCGHFGLCFF